MEIEILKRNVNDLNAAVDRMYLYAQSEEISLSGNLFQINNFLAALSEVKACGNICKLAIERLEENEIQRNHETNKHFS